MTTASTMSSSAASPRSATARGARRSTLDIVPAPTRTNLVRLAAALAAIDAHVRGVDAHPLDIDPRDPETLAGGADLDLATELGILDILQNLIAVDYAQLRARYDLIAMKLRAGRPIDLQDIAAITGHELRDAPPGADRRS
jgi:hypothetical protein